MDGKVILAGDFNAHSSECNLHCGGKRDTVGVESLIEGYSLILNTKPGEATRPTRRSTTSVIDLNFTTQQVGALDKWGIDGELSTLSHHEVIVFDMASPDNTASRMRTSQEVTGWSDKGLPEKTRKETSVDWHQAAAGYPGMREESFRDNIEDEANWINSPSWESWTSTPYR